MGDHVIIDHNGAILGAAVCVHCPHTLNDHNGGVPGGYLKCDQCDCAGFCDRPSAWWLESEISTD